MMEPKTLFLLLKNQYYALQDVGFHINGRHISYFRHFDEFDHISHTNSQKRGKKGVTWIRVEGQLSPF